MLVALLLHDIQRSLLNLHEILLQLLPLQFLAFEYFLNLLILLLNFEDHYCNWFFFHNYFHFASGGSDINIESIFPPEFNPNLVPLSYKRLNSTYLPRLKNCFSLSFFVHLNFSFLFNNFF